MSNLLTKDRETYISRKAQLAGMLEMICNRLELTETQFRLAEKRYQGVGEWLARSPDLLLRGVSIYPQGSISLGTTTKPISRKEFDIDLVCFAPGFNSTHPPATLKKAIGDRLRASGDYQGLLEEKKRCWRLNYADEFHIDITPSIINPACPKGGELVPDKELLKWKETNPKGYVQWFGEIARLNPSYSIPGLSMDEAFKFMANVKALPQPTGFKGILRRTVQLCKRHRDMYFDGKATHDHAPLSVILTTLAAKSYRYCVDKFTYETEFDVVADVVRHLPFFIERPGVSGGHGYAIWNETTKGENFAEKWNRHPSYANAFMEWHDVAVGDFSKLHTLSGLDAISEHLGSAFGRVSARKAVETITEMVSEARAARKLTVTPTAGITIASPLGKSVPANTFFGA